MAVTETNISCLLSLQALCRIRRCRRHADRHVHGKGQASATTGPSFTMCSSLLPLIILFLCAKKNCVYDRDLNTD